MLSKINTHLKNIIRQKKLIENPAIKFLIIPNVRTIAKTPPPQSTQLSSAGLSDIEHMHDIGVVHVHAHPSFIEEHGQEFLVFGQVRKNALDGDLLLEALDALGDALKDLGHSAGVDLSNNAVFVALRHSGQGSIRNFPFNNQGFKL